MNESDAATYRRADKICRELGLGCFCDLAWTSADVEILRWVFMPSFHAQGCITLTTAGGSPSCHVRFQRSFRSTSTVGSRIPTLLDERFPWPSRLLPEVFEHWSKAMDAVNQRGNLRYIGLDGMALAGARCGAGQCERIGGSYVEPAFHAMTVLLLKGAHRWATDVRIKNRLADCLNYCRVCVKRESEPGQVGGLPSVGLIVLGAADDRVELAQALCARGVRVPPPKLSEGAAE